MLCACTNRYVRTVRTVHYVVIFAAVRLYFIYFTYTFNCRRCVLCMEIAAAVTVREQENVRIMIAVIHLRKKQTFPYYLKWRGSPFPLIEKPLHLCFVFCRFVIAEVAHKIFIVHFVRLILTFKLKQFKADVSTGSEEYS